MSAVALTVGLTTACGSSSSKANPPSSSGSVPAPTGSTIKIGVVGSNTGSQASSSSQGATVGPAWAEWVNKELGGIAGHPVEIVSLDDKGDPVAGAAVGKEFISDGVVAVVPGSDNLVPAFDDALIAAKIPIVSGASNSTDWYQKVGMFPTNTDTVSGTTSHVQVAKQFGKATKVAAIYCAEVAACQQAIPIQEKVAQSLGVSFSSLAVSSTAVSYTSQCLTLKQQKVEDVLLLIAASTSAKVIQDCQAQGYNPIWGTNVQSIGPDLLNVKDATMYGGAYVFPSTADSPIVKTYTDAMKKYAKGDNWHDGSSAFAWTGLEVIRQSLLAAKVSASSPVTGQMVTDALNAVKDNDFGGMLPNKITFTAGKTVPFGGHPCYFVVGVKDGKVTAPNGLTPVCPAS